ncbi:MAG: EMC3/TMCO1 family protein [archaeon]
MDKEGKEGSFKPVMIVLILSFIIAIYWDSQTLTFIKDFVHIVLDPSAGALLEWNITYGMMIIVLIISLITILVQKYTTDQETLRELRKEQKILQEEMKKFKDHPEKLIELQKKQFEFVPKTMKLTMRPIIFTGIPFILFFRWFHDFFTLAGNPEFFGFLNWFWFYLIFAIIFSSIFKKILKVV